MRITIKQATALVVMIALLLVSTVGLGVWAVMSDKASKLPDTGNGAAGHDNDEEKASHAYSILYEGAIPVIQGEDLNLAKYLSGDFAAAELVDFDNGVVGEQTVAIKLTYDDGFVVNATLDVNVMAKTAETEEEVKKAESGSTGSTSTGSTGGSTTPNQTTKEVTTTETIAYSTTYRDNASLEKGSERVVQTGVNGVRTNVTRVTYAGTVETKKEVISSKVTQEAVNQIVERGTKVAATPAPTPAPEPLVTTKDLTTTEEVAFTTEYRDNASLAKGVENVIQNGSNGTRTIVTRVTYTDGKETGRSVVSNTVTTNPVNKIIERGTKVEVTYSTTWYSTEWRIYVEEAEAQMKIDADAYMRANNYGRYLWSSVTFKGSDGSTVKAYSVSFMDRAGNDIYFASSNVKVQLVKSGNQLVRK